MHPVVAQIMEEGERLKREDPQAYLAFLQELKPELEKFMSLLEEADKE